MITLTPGWAGFLKGLLMTGVWAVVAFLAVSAHFSGILPDGIATIVAALFSALESSHKAGTDGTQALFGAVNVKRV